MSPTHNNVMLVSTNLRLRSVLPALLRREQALDYRGSVLTPIEALTVVTTQPLDLIISDLPPADAQEILTWRTIRNHVPRVIMLTRYLHGGAGIRSVLAGASGLVLVPEGSLMDAVKRVINGEVLRTNELQGYLHAVVTGEVPSTLDGVQRRLLGLIAEGRSDQEIAAETGVPFEDTREHILALAQKLA